MSTPFHLGYRPALDGLRAIAVTMVILAHANLFYPRLDNWLLRGGHIGVDLFFVLSGFLITSLLLEERGRTDDISLRGFYLRRVARLLPALYVFLACHIAYTLAVDAPAYLEAKNVALIVGNVVNWTMLPYVNDVPLSLAQLWSLSIEEQFYAIWPVALIGLVRLRAVTIKRLLVAGIATIGLTRVLLSVAGVEWHTLYITTPFRFDALLMGALAAVALQQGWRPGPRWNAGAWVAIGYLAVCATVTPVGLPAMDRGGYQLVGVAATVLVVALLDQTWVVSRLLSRTTFVVVGRASYTLYVWHLFVFVAVFRFTEGVSTPLRTLLVAVVLVAVTLASRRFVEVPAMRWLRSKQPKPPIAPAGAEQVTKGSKSRSG